MKIERGAKVLVDTNVLLEATDQGRAWHAKAQALFRYAADDGVDLYLATQIVREYLVVATRPVANNGLGMSPVKALENIRAFRKKASLVTETMRAGELFLEWVLRFGVSGKKLHDLQILATAHASGMHAVVTANEDDFPPSSGLTVIPLAEYER